MSNFLRKFKQLNIYLKSFLLIAILGYLGHYAFTLHSLFTKDYTIKDTDIYLLDSFHLHGEVSEIKGGRNRPPRIEFNTTYGYFFTFETPIYGSILDKQELLDTLQSDDLNFKVYVDKETFTKYKQKEWLQKIHVLQFQIGDKKYIDLNQANRSLRWGKLAYLILIPYSIWFLIFIYSNKEEWNKEEQGIWTVVFFVSALLLFFLIR